MKRIVAGITLIIAIIVALFAFKDTSQGKNPEIENYEIIQKWELPKELNEISGISWIGDGLVACVQDEDGIIFIYNLNNSKIEERIHFGNGGDYEGISVYKDNAYVLRSDGVIYEVSNFKGDRKVIEYISSPNKLPGINLEGLSLDPRENRLLLAVKERRQSDDLKEFFTFDLSEKSSKNEPLFSIFLDDSIFDPVKGKTKHKFNPGEIGVHPDTGAFYILDGSRPKLLITDRQGKTKQLFILNPKDFANPEGLTFSPDGTLYISNEAQGKPANILKIRLNQVQ